MTEEYFNQLVEYYKEALTNSMVNEGQAKNERRYLRALRAYKEAGENSSPDILSLNRDLMDISRDNMRRAELRNIRIASGTNYPVFRNRALVQLRDAPDASRVIHNAAFDIAFGRQYDKLKAKGIPYEYTAGKKTREKMRALWNKKR